MGDQSIAMQMHLHHKTRKGKVHTPNRSWRLWSVLKYRIAIVSVCLWDIMILCSTAGLLTHEEPVGSKFRPPSPRSVIVRRGGVMTAAEQAIIYSCQSPL